MRMSHGVLEFCSLLGSAGRVPSAVGMRARSGELAAVDDQIFITDRSALEPAFENLACPRRVPGLRRKRSSGDVGRHAMVWHGPPGMVLRRWLGEPHVSGVAAKLAAFESADDGVSIADLAARGGHEVSASLHFGKKLVIEEALCFGMKRRIDSHDIADLDHILDIGMPREIQFLFDRFWQSMSIEVVQVHIEGLESAQHRETNPAGSDCADMHSLNIIRTLDAVRDVPTALYDPLVRRDVIADEAEDHHHDVLCDADRIAVG